MIGARSQSLRQAAPRYARSMESLVEAYSSLPGRISSHTQYKLLEQKYEEESDPASLYFLREESTRWRAHFKSVPDVDKHKELVKRQVGRRLLEARVRGTCLFCWFPEDEACLCDSFILPHQQSVLPLMRGLTGQSGEGVVNIEVSFILHADELFRQTNTAHIAAIVMDSPLVVWGVDGVEHQDRIAVLGMDQGTTPATEREVGKKSTSRSETVVDVLLYPEVGKSVSVKELISSHPVSSGSDLTFHLHLSDGTWSQARSVNRHVPRSVPRLMLDVDASYEALFGALRSRTRETGVSTLEATALAVSQLRKHFSPEVTDASSEPLEESMRLLMKRYVDFTSMFTTKTGYVPTTLSIEEQQEVVVRRNRYKAHMQRWEEEDREQLRLMALEQSLRTSSAAGEETAANSGEPPVLPVAAPVCYFCYVCDVYIHPICMPQHCSGKRHIDNLLKTGNFSYTPSEASRLMQRPLRSEVVPKAL